jgi:hypothetical protein
VFFIQRNKNRNEVHYGIHLDEACRPLGDGPVYNYWRRIEEGPGVVKPVTLLQQAGYGFRSQRVEGGSVLVTLRALPERAIRVEATHDANGCRARAYMEIAGRPNRFRRAYVYAEPGVVLPNVKYIELFGTAADGSDVREHMTVSE